MTTSPSAELFSEKKTDAILLLSRLGMMTVRAKQGAAVDPFAINLITLAMESNLQGMVAHHSSLPEEDKRHSAMNLVMALGNCYTDRVQALQKLPGVVAREMIPLKVSFQSQPLSFRSR